MLFGLDWMDPNWLLSEFGGLFFWGWLWGPWGMMLAFPMMVVIKTIVNRIEPLEPLGEMLGR